MDSEDTLQVVKDRRGTDRRVAQKAIAHADRRVRNRRSGDDRRDQERLEF